MKFIMNLVMDSLNPFLKATNIEVGLLLNFGRKPEFKRYIFNNKQFNPRKSVAKITNQYKSVRISG